MDFLKNAVINEHCKQLGLNASKLDDEEWRAMMKVLERSPLLKRRGRKNK